MRGRSNVRNPWYGMLAGALAGLVAAWVMERLQAAVSEETDDGAEDAQRLTGHRAAWDARVQDQLSGADEPATVAAADAGAEVVLGRRLGVDEWNVAGPVMHYAFGATMGALYGGLAETRPEVTRLTGIPFGLTVWSAADELGVPLLGLAPPPYDRPLRAHAYSFLSHVVFGMTTEGVRYVLRGSASRSTG